MTFCFDISSRENGFLFRPSFECSRKSAKSELAEVRLSLFAQMLSNDQSCASKRSYFSPTFGLLQRRPEPVMDCRLDGSKRRKRRKRRAKAAKYVKKMALL